MNGPPDQKEDFHGQPVEFWFGVHPTARCGNVTIELHHHPTMFPEAPYLLEPFGRTLGGGFWHYSGKQFEERPTEPEIVLHSLKLLELLRKRGDWYPTKLPVSQSSTRPETEALPL